MTRLRGLIDTVDPSMPDLPLVHTTDAFRFDKLIPTKQLQPIMCPVFHEPLLYFFYARPAYRTRKRANENLYFDLPVVMSMHPNAKIPPIKRAFPLDTGAFAAGKYISYFHQDTELDDLQLDSSIDGVRRYLSMMYSSSSEYYNGSTRKNVNIGVNDHEAAGLHELAKTPASPVDTGRRPPDERSSSVELQFDQPFDLKGNLLALIVPQVLLDDDNISTAVYSFDAKYLKTYPVMSRMESEFIAGTIYQILRDIYEREGLVAR